MGPPLKTSYKVREALTIKNRAISTKEPSPKAVLIFNMWSSANSFLIWGVFYFGGVVSWLGGAQTAVFPDTTGPVSAISTSDALAYCSFK